MTKAAAAQEWTEVLTMAIKLKLCPFCGHEPIIGRHYTGMRKADYRIECKGCLIRQVWYRRLKDAAKAWNRRDEDAEAKP